MVSSLRLLTVCVLVVVFAYAFVDWWNPFGADGIITKIVESLPGGGFITAPFHAAAGNIAHAIQAAIAGFGTLAALAIGGPPGALAVSVAAAIAGLSSTVAELDKAGHLQSLKNHNDSWSPEEVAGLAVFYIHEKTDGGLEDLFDKLKLSNAKKDEALRGIRNRKPHRVGLAFLEAVDEKIRKNSEELAGQSRSKRDRSSAESGGRKILQSGSDYYLRANRPEKKVDMVSRERADEWEHWYVEDWSGTVVFKSRGAPHLPGLFLRAYSNGTVNLTGAHPNHVQPKGTSFWKPFKNPDGYWSFLSVHGTWLSARPDGSVRVVANCGARERFWLSRW